MCIASLHTRRKREPIQVKRGTRPTIVIVIARRRAKTRAYTVLSVSISVVIREAIVAIVIIERSDAHADGIRALATVAHI